MLLKSMSLYFSILVLQGRDYEIYLKFICRFTICMYGGIDICSFDMFSFLHC